MSSKTLYDVLGVMQTANAKEIQKAFRQLSKTVHPDVSDASDAPEKFARIKEAYEILSNEELRKKYDDQLKAGNNSMPDMTFDDIFAAFFSQKGGPSKPIRGDNIEVKMQVTAEEILRATPKTLNLKRQKTCTDCMGSGRKEAKGSCKHCKGEGGHEKRVPTPFGTLAQFENCVHCNGSGKAEFVTCKKCDGKGTTPETEVFEFQLDPQSRFGQTMVFRHKGNVGFDGGETGDLRVLLQQSEYDRIKVQFDYDLHERKFVPLRTVLLGNPYEVVLPDGTTEMVKLSDEVNKGNTLVFPEKGFYDDNGNRGFYNLEVVVEFPELTRLQRNNILNALGDD